MSVARYQGEMKDSGIEWIGEIPMHWEVKRLKFTLQTSKGSLRVGPFGSSLKSTDMQGDFAKVYNQRTVIDDDFFNGNLYVTEEKYQELSSFSVDVGDMLITTRGTIGKVAIVPKNAEKGILHPCLISLKFNENRFYKSWMKLLLSTKSLVLPQLNYLSNSTTIEVVYSYSLKEIYLPSPPMNEQQLIATYLDRKTQAIDALITAREEQIARLQEKRASLIHRAVTKGITEGVEMKDSGIEWIGEIPKHWELKSMRSVLRQRREFNDGPKTEQILSVGRNFGVIPYEDREASGNKKSDNIEQYKIIYPGDIVLNRMNIIIGSVGVSKYYGASSVEYYVLYPRHEQVSNEYYGHIFCESTFQTSLVGIGSGILAHRMRISYEKLRMVYLPVPPFNEQVKIASYLNEKFEQLDRLVETVQSTITTLKEYRQSLITEAVTGKLDPQAMQAYLDKPSTIEDSV